MTFSTSNGKMEMLIPRIPSLISTMILRLSEPALQFRDTLLEVSPSQVRTIRNQVLSLHLLAVNIILLIPPVGNLGIMRIKNRLKMILSVKGTVKVMRFVGLEILLLLCMPKKTPNFFSK